MAATPPARPGTSTGANRCVVVPSPSWPSRFPDLIDAGVDILNPVQWRCRGMDREELARDFGAQMIFHGGIDNQQTLPFGTPDDVRRQVAENVRIFANGKGYIAAPCHNIQPNTPTANILALYEAVAAARP